MSRRWLLASVTWTLRGVGVAAAVVVFFVLLEVSQQGRTDLLTEDTTPSGSRG